MMKTAQSSLREVDLVLYVVDAAESFGPGEEFIIERLKEAETPTFFSHQ